MRRTLIIPATLLMAALALAGCSAGGSSSSVPGSGSGGVIAPQPTDGTGFSTGSGSMKSEAATTDRQVIESGYVTIVVAKPLTAAADAVRITESAGGRVDGRTEFAPVAGDAGSATLSLRIPATALNATLDKLRDLGRVQEVSLSSSDVTMQTQDLDARITALSASVDRLVGLLATATTTDTLIALETAISDRQGELESLKSQQRYLADQVSMSTVSLNLISEAKAKITAPDNFFAGIVAGWNAFVAFFAGLLVTLGVLLPWIGLAAVVALVVILLVRRNRRRTVAAQAAPAALASSTAPPATAPPAKKR